MTTRTNGRAAGIGETAAWSVLILLAIIAARNARDGTLGRWLRVKFLNQGVSGAGNPLLDPSVANAAARALGAVSAAGAAVATGPLGGGGGRLADPVPGGRTGDGFGVPRAGGARTHKGIDIIAACGTAVRAAEAGKISTFRLSLCGIGANIRHSGDLSTDYCHMGRYAVRNGSTVRRGQVIGYVGNTGNSDGCHLHFEVNVNGREVDPGPYIGR